jgi:proton-translocating NADH-quinone oxidoreductase chain N
VLLAAERLLPQRQGFGEFFVLLIFFVLALSLMASAGDLIVFYLAFELSSICGYLLASWLRDDPKSAEAGLKYFVYGAAASGVMLYGLSLLYGIAGTLHIGQLADALAMNGGYLGVVAAGLVLVGIGYKIAMCPFHWWAPDVYEGAPTPVTAFLSVGPKIAGFALLIRLLNPLTATSPNAWLPALGVLCAATMFTGNLLAIRQSNIKRMLAYSSIAHAGYLLIGVTVATTDPVGLQAVLVYAVAYLFMNMGAFAVATYVEQETGSSLLSGFTGLSQRAPLMALAMVVFLLSLVGVPPTAGFVGKLMLFAAAIKTTGFAWLAILGIINSVVSVYYYMNVVREMYFGKAAEAAPRRAPGVVSAAVVIAALGTLLVGIGPERLVSIAQASCRTLGGL